MTIFIFNLHDTHLETPFPKSDCISILIAIPGTDLFFYRVAKYWNNLDKSISSAKSLTVFKSKLKTTSLDKL